MATLEALMAVVGQSVETDAVQSLIAADRLTEVIEFDLGGGESRRFSLAHRAGDYQLSHQRGRIDLAIVYARAGRGFEAFDGPLPGGLPLRCGGRACPLDDDRAHGHSTPRLIAFA